MGSVLRAISMAEFTAWKRLMRVRGMVEGISAAVLKVGARRAGLVDAAEQASLFNSFMMIYLG